MFMWNVSRRSLQLGLPTRSQNAIPSAAVFIIKCFEAVHDLDAKENVAVLRRFDCFFDALHCTLSKDFFVFART